MAKEIRNLKGEIVEVKQDSTRPFFGYDSWLFLAGGLLLIMGGIPGVPERLFQWLDFRLWPWWYHLVLLILLAFSVKWFFIYNNWEDYDKVERDTAMRFKRMSVAVTALMLLCVFLNTVGLFRIIYFSLYSWLGYGAFSWLALISFFAILGVIAPALYFIKEWLITFKQDCNDVSPIDIDIVVFGGDDLTCRS